MYSLIQKRKTIAILIIVTFSAFSIISSPADALMINTGEISNQNHRDLLRYRINKLIERSEIQKYLAARGIISP
jgi:hypothetical protein